MFEPKRDQPLAIGLAALAGFADAVGFLWLGGVFISFMTGNSTRLGTELGGADWSQALVPAAVISTFVGGVVLATLVRRATRRGRLVIMLWVTGLLLLAAALQEVGHQTLALVAATVALGAENTVFEHDGEVSVGVTYMTGTLVKMGQHVATALTGGPRLGWLPFFCRWLGLLGGAVAGTLVYQRLGLEALWVAAALGAAFTVATLRHPGD